MLKKYSSLFISSIAAIMAMLTPQFALGADDIPPPEKPPSWLRYLENFRLDGYIQFWYRVEMSENDRLQSGSDDEAAQISSGFSIRTARAALGYYHERFNVRFELRLESTVDIMDCYAALHLYRNYADLWVGQFKIPSTYEVAVSNTDLDFATLGMFSDRVTNYALSKHASLTSPFQGIRTYQRDAGVGLKGSISGLDYFLMVGNGLGANLFIGAAESKQYVYSNKVGAYFYAGRLSFDAARAFPDFSNLAYIRQLSIGGHFSYNRHPNMLFGDTRTVLDLKRFSWSADMQLKVTDYVKLTGLYGQGAIDDDFDFDGKRDYWYEGWEAKVVVYPLPDVLAFAFRADGFKSETGESGWTASELNYTAGAEFRFWKHFRIAVNYKWKTLSSPKEKDLDDDALTFLFQAQL